MSTPTSTPLVIPGHPRAEVAALATAIENPLEGFDAEGHVGLMVLFPHGLALDLMILIADLCGPEHVSCWACGEKYACTKCGLGDLHSWCWSPSGFAGPLCPDCRYGNCRLCANGGH